MQTMTPTPPSTAPQPLTPNPVTLRADELLPDLSRWATWTGVVLTSGVVATLALAAIAKYNVAVKATATVRPAGELRVVQAEAVQT